MANLQQQQMGVEPEALLALNTVRPARSGQYCAFSVRTGRRHHEMAACYLLYPALSDLF